MKKTEEVEVMDVAGPEALEVLEPLGRDEKSRLKRLEENIARGITRFMLVGQALAEIRDKRLYREGFGTFEDYLRERWGITRQYAYAQIKGAEVVNNLSTIADKLPENETQVRPLTRLTPEKQIEVWEEALRAEEPVTGELVRRLAKAHIPPREVFEETAGYKGEKGSEVWSEKCEKDFVWFYERLIASVPQKNRIASEERIWDWIDKRRWEVAKRKK